MAYARQTTYLPTNKLAIASLIGPAAVEAYQAVMLDIYPPLSGEAMSMLVGAFVALSVGYFVPDRPNMANP